MGLRDFRLHKITNLKTYQQLQDDVDEMRANHPLGIESIIRDDIDKSSYNDKEWDDYLDDLATNSEKLAEPGRQVLKRYSDIEIGAKMSDPINPSHYKDGEIECIDALREQLGDENFMGFCQGNAAKYIWRAGKKGDMKEDIKKAIWYLRMMIGDDPRV